MHSDCDRKGGGILDLGCLSIQPIPDFVFAFIYVEKAKIF